jgi:hypothetical protein
MSRQETKVLEGISSYLEPGEEPLVAIVAQPKGTTKGVAGTGALGVGGGALGGRERRTAHEAAGQAGIVLSSPCAVVLTRKQLLTVDISPPIGLGLGGKVKQVLSSVPIADVASIEVRKIALRQNITLHIRGESIQLEANPAASGKELASTLASLKG